MEKYTEEEQKIIDNKIKKVQNYFRNNEIDPKNKKYFWHGVPIAEVVEIINSELACQTILGRISRIRKELKLTDAEAVDYIIKRTIINGRTKVEEGPFEGLTANGYAKKHKCSQRDLKENYESGIKLGFSEEKSAQRAIEVALNKKFESNFRLLVERFGTRYHNINMLDLLPGEIPVILKSDGEIKYCLTSYGKLLEYKDANQGNYRYLNHAGNLTSKKDVEITYDIGDQTIIESLDIKTLYPQFFLGNEAPNKNQVLEMINNPEKRIKYPKIFKPLSIEKHTRLLNDSDTYGISTLGIITKKIEGKDGCLIYTPLNKYGDREKEIKIGAKVFKAKDLYKIRFHKEIPTIEEIKYQINHGKQHKISEKLILETHSPKDERETFSGAEAAMLLSMRLKQR